MDGVPTIMSLLALSWARSRAVLFPFRFKFWLRVLIVVWFAGAGIHGCSTNFGIPTRSAPSSSVSEIKVTAQPSPASSVKTPPLAGTLGSIPGPGPSSQPETKISPAHSREEPVSRLKTNLHRLRSKARSVWSVWIVVGLAVLGLALSAFFAWLSCRFNFVLLDVILMRESKIKEGFKRHKESGNSYFGWTLTFLGICLAAFLLAGLITVLSLGIAKWSLVLGIPLMALGGLSILAVIVAMIFVGAVMHDFALPIMYSEGISAMSALNKFLDSVEFTFGKVFQYLLVTFVLWILFAILQSVVAILLAIGGLIAGGILAVLGFILIKVFSFLTMPLIVLGSLIAVVLILTVIVMIGMVMLPAAIFLRAFALAYLTRLYPECDLLAPPQMSA